MVGHKIVTGWIMGGLCQCLDAAAQGLAAKALALAHQWDSRKRMGQLQLVFRAPASLAVIFCGSTRHGGGQGCPHLGLVAVSPTHAWPKNRAFTKPPSLFWQTRCTRNLREDKLDVV